VVGLDFFVYAFLVPLLPALAFVVLGLTGKSFRNGGGLLAVGAEGLALLLSVFFAYEESVSTTGIYHDSSFVWMGLPDGTNFVMGTLMSPLGALMLLVVNIVGFLVVVYSLEYMSHEEGLPRYYAELMLFLTAMNLVCLADNFLEFILAWELVGLCSYLLIGFFWKKPEAASAAKKAFLVTRVGDVLFFVGVFIFFTSLAGVVNPSITTLPYQGQVCPGGQVTWACAGFTFAPPNANSNAPFLAPGTITSPGYGSNLMTLAGLLILGGAAGKSAQFPLHTWLPDAMEGPTTVSALIHAATMVAAGVFLLAITSIYIGFTSTAALVILGIGSFTSLFAGTMGVVARDIKRAIAYSTMSQLGYMVMGVGASSLVLVGPGDAMFHLFTHAFFKALLFLSAGSVIHAVGTQDLFAMGGLLRKMPVTAFTMLIGALALSGIPPFSGFFSKDGLLALTWAASQHYAVALPFFLLALVGVFLTGFYIFRLWFLTFSGSHSRTPGLHGHEPSWIMRAPLVALAGLTLVAGVLPLFGGFANLLPGVQWGTLGYSYTSSGWVFSSSDLMVAIASLVLAFAGVGTAYVFWGNGRVFSLPENSWLRAPHTLLLRKYYFDEVYDGLAHGVILGVARGLDWFDRYVIDGTIHAFERLFSQASERGRRIQSGLVSNYASWIALGLVVLLVAIIYGIPWLDSLWGGG
jgi:NADH-quinone oxidoreductase subunit L